MTSIAINIAFILGFWIAPANAINDFLLLIGLRNYPLSRALTGQAIQYAIPAVFFYWLLWKETIRSRVTVTDRSLWVLRICNTISIAYVVTRLFAGLIPGGGPGFVVSQYGIVTIVPAIGISMLVIVQVAKRSYGSTGLTGSVVVGILLLGTVPLRSYMQKFHAEDEWEQYCKESGDHFISKPIDFKVLQFRGMGEIEVFTSVVAQSYAEAHREFVGASLIKRGLLQEYEDVNPAANRPSKRIFYANGVQEEPLMKSQATHSVSISFPESIVPRFQRLRISVVDLRTGLVVAESNRVVDNIAEKKRVCGGVNNGNLDASDFVVKALELTPAIRN